MARYGSAQRPFRHCRDRQRRLSTLHGGPLFTASNKRTRARYIKGGKGECHEESACQRGHRGGDVQSRLASPIHARMKFALDEIEKGATFSKGQELDAERAALMPSGP
jgi:hypothetical protein